MRPKNGSQGWQASPSTRPEVVNKVLTLVTADMSPAFVGAVLSPDSPVIAGRSPQ